jgi:hypothetical protein
LIQINSGSLMFTLSGCLAGHVTGFYPMLEHLNGLIFLADVAWHRLSGKHADMACTFRRRGGLTVWVTPATIAAWMPAQRGRRNRADAAVGFRSAVAPD